MAALSEATLGDITFDAQGLIPAIVQHADTGEVRMLGYMNRAALERTLTSGRVWFWSRSRQSFWMKGESSGNILEAVGETAAAAGGEILENVAEGAINAGGAVLDAAGDVFSSAVDGLGDLASDVGGAITSGFGLFD